jgi:tight adherence protein C
VDSFLTLYNDMLATKGTDLALALVFLSTFFVVLAVGHWLFTGSAVQRRLRTIAGEKEPGKTVVTGENAFTVHWLKPAVTVFMPKAEWRRSSMQTMLVRAGYRNPNALTVFLSVKLFLAIGLPLVLLVLSTMVEQAEVITVQGLVFALIVSALIGFYLPNLFLYRRIRNRKIAFTEGFPDALDMMVVCVEAGLGLDSAIQRVGEEIAIAHPDLAAEFRLISLELRAGKDRTEALRSLGDRVDLDDVRALASLLIQAEHFGTGVASALRVYASDLRLQRIQRARVKAAKLPVKLIFPILLCIFPALFLVFLGPGVIRIIETLGHLPIK